VSIKLKLDPADSSSLHAGLSPVHEALLSLHVLLHPWAHPLQHPWVRAMRSLSPSLKRDVRTFAFLYYDATPDCFIPVGGDDEATFEAGLAAAAALPTDNVRFALARPLFFYGSEAGVTVDDARDRIRANAARYGDSTSAVVELLLDAPEVFLHRLLDFLHAYWEETFAATWSDLEPLLQRELERARRSAEFVAREARRTPVPTELAGALRAAGDSSRLEILRLVARRPRTTEELAALVGLSTSGLSKHLRALTEVRLVTSRRDGWYVLYSAERDRLASLSDDLLGYLDA
jgi:DNA-binding transcriptional ArsR family regulator